MLIELENVSAISNTEQKLALTNLLRAHQDGFHFIFINEAPENLRDLDLEFLGYFEKATFCSLIDNFTTRAQLTHDLVIKTTVDFLRRTNTAIYDVNSSAIESCYSKFINPRACHPTRLVLEDESDEELYSLITWKLNSKLLQTPDSMSYEVIHGGGSRTVRAFKAQKRLGYFTLCIVDSDRPHPKKGIGSTARALNQNIQNGVSDFTFVKLLDVHEVENLIPISTLCEVTKQDYGHNLDYVDKLKDLLAVDESLQKYLDLKKGLSLESAWSLDKQYGGYWLSESIREAFLKPRCRACLRESSGGSFICVNGNECSYLEPFNDSLLEKGAEKIKLSSSNGVAKSLNHLESEVWKEISELISAWCYSETVSVCS